MWPNLERNSHWTAYQQWPACDFVTRAMSEGTTAGTREGRLLGAETSQTAAALMEIQQQPERKGSTTTKQGEARMYARTDRTVTANWFQQAITKLGNMRTWGLAAEWSWRPTSPPADDVFPVYANGSEFWIMEFFKSSKNRMKCVTKFFRSCQKIQTWRFLHTLKQ